MSQPSSFDGELIANLPGSPLRRIRYDYTSEAEIREHVMSAIKLNSKRTADLKKLQEAGIEFDPTKMKVKISDEQKMKLTEEWIQKLIYTAKKQHRLMSDQQLQDWRLGVRLVRGARARYIGPSRDERTDNNLIVPRENGQLGTIIRVQETKRGSKLGEGRIITFRPATAVVPVSGSTEPQFVDLTVREGTPGWLHLERIPF